MSALQTAPQVSSPALVSLYHTLLITAMAGPLSQRMPSSFSGATCSQGAASRLSVLGRETDSPVSLGPSFADYLFASWEDGEVDLFAMLFFIPSPLGERQLLKKFLLWLFFPPGVAQTPRLVSTSLSLFFLRCSLPLWPLAPLFHTAVYYFDQYPPFPLLSLPLSLPPSPP